MSSNVELVQLMEQLAAERDLIRKQNENLIAMIKNQEIEIEKLKTQLPTSNSTIKPPSPLIIVNQQPGSVDSMVENFEISMRALLMMDEQPDGKTMSIQPLETPPTLEDPFIEADADLSKENNIEPANKINESSDHGEMNLSSVPDTKEEIHVVTNDNGNQENNFPGVINAMLPPPPEFVEVEVPNLERKRSIREQSVYFSKTDNFDFSASQKGQDVPTNQFEQLNSNRKMAAGTTLEDDDHKSKHVEEISKDSNEITPITDENVTVSVPITSGISEEDNDGDRFNILAAQPESVSIEVIGTAVFLNDKGKEYTAFVINVSDYSGYRWRVSKKYSDFLQLHGFLKATIKSNVLASIGHSAPQKELFVGAARLSPIKTEKRRQELQDYLTAVLTHTRVLNGAILTFLSQDVVEVVGEAPRVVSGSIKEGYLSKKGKNFGGWKQRYVVLLPKQLEFYESKEIANNQSSASNRKPLKVINLVGCQIGRKKGSDTRHKEFLHAILINELNKDGTKTTTVLCAEHDKQRDDWILHLAIQADSMKPQNVVAASKIHSNPNAIKEMKPTETNTSVSLDRNPISSVEPRSSSSTISRVSDMFVNRDSKMFPKMNNFISSSSIRANVPVQAHRIFGVPLSVATSESRINEGYEIPSVVYRCIEFLDAEKAYLEEGIYRINGSAKEMQQLKNEFETFGDVDLLNRSPKPDINSVAGLLKLFFRQINETILTPELQSEFHHILDLNEREDKLVELARLVSILPAANYSTFRTLIGHLIQIIQHAEVNKMPARNVGIVFCPTLAIPAGIFLMMLNEYEFVFGITSTTKESSQNISKEQEISTDDLMKVNVQHVEKSNNRFSWSVDQVPVNGRNNRNSFIYESNAPESFKQVEQEVVEGNKLSNAHQIKEEDESKFVTSVDFALDNDEGDTAVESGDAPVPFKFDLPNHFFEPQPIDVPTIISNTSRPRSRSTKVARIDSEAMPTQNSRRKSSASKISVRGSRRFSKRLSIPEAVIFPSFDNLPTPISTTTEYNVNNVIGNPAIELPPSKSDSMETALTLDLPLSIQKSPVLPQKLMSPVNASYIEQEHHNSRILSIYGHYEKYESWKSESTSKAKTEKAPLSGIFKEPPTDEVEYEFEYEEYEFEYEEDYEVVN